MTPTTLMDPGTIRESHVKPYSPECRTPSPTLEMRWSVVLFWTLLTAYVAWIFVLPAFPTQDGPVHLYYAHVVSELMSGHTPYAQFYYIQHWFPPYALHTYLLLGLIKLFSPLMAEKVMTAITVACFAGGIFFLMRSLKDSEPIMSLFAVPLSLNWALFMGFYNYVLALGLMFFAIGCWYRGCSFKSKKYFAVYLFILATIALTHPVPLLMALLVCGLDFLVRFLKMLINKAPVRAIRQEFIVTGLSGLPALYVALFVDPAASGITGPNDYRLSIASLFRGAYVSPLRGSGMSAVAFSSAIESIIVLCCIAGFTRCFYAQRRKRLWGVETLFLMAFAFFMAAPFLPFTSNGGYFLGPRFAVAGVVLLLVAGNAAMPVRPFLRRVILGAGVAAAVLALTILHIRTAPIARDMAAMQQLPPFSSTVKGVLMYDGVEKVQGLSFRPYYWAGARSFLSGHAVILNSPWLFSPFSMLASRPPIMNYSAANEPVQLLLLMKLMPSYRENIQSSASATFTGSADRKVREIARNLAFGQSKISCESSDWYEMCLKEESGVASTTAQQPISK